MRKKRIFKIILPLFSALILLRLFASHRSFTDFTMSLFRHELSGNTLTLHYTLTDPSAYGIDDSLISLGSLSEETLTDELAYLNSCLETLHNFQEDGLSDSDALTADLLEWWLDGQLQMEDYYYYQEPLGPTLGVQAQLPVLLAEFAFREEADIQTYLMLLAALPDYFSQICAFEQEKSAQGLFMNDEILEEVIAQCQSVITIDDNHFLIISFRERLNECSFLDENQKTVYEIRNREALSASFVPAYENLCSTLNALKGTGQNEYGLYYTPKGVPYFEYLLQYSIGTDRSIAQIRRLLEEQMAEDYARVLYAVSQGVDLTSYGQSAESNELPAYILSALQEQIAEDFPQTQTISWQIKEVPDSLSPYLSPAFYLTPPIDAEQQNVIYINPSASMDRVSLITTLAHEGYPGHLYQNSFENQDSYNPVRNLIYIGGYTEGWGLYSEFYAYDFLGLSDLEADALRSLSSLNYAICASLDLSIHADGWTENECVQYLKAFGITDTEQVHELYRNILEEPSNYLKYYLGYLEICNLKESALALSDDITVYDFHKWFLENGPAPFSILQELLESPEIAAQLLQRADENLHLLALKSVHDSLDHAPVEFRVALIGGQSSLRQREQDDPLVLRAANA